MLEEEDLRKIVQAVRAVLNAEQSVSGTIGDRWAGGQLVLRPGKAGTQEKVVPIDGFFRKIINVRERLRVLEQRINSHPKLDNLIVQEGIPLQEEPHESSPFKICAHGTSFGPATKSSRL